ncbi:variable surface lipoprotein [Mycoplasma sp. 21DD0573]|uniref:variable surface lipoprotein n=1 Tax=unclassified Mycoplasma TaxID=2683645 RepID=UPI002B1D7B8B|nr:variable surface lipoprotein [Mycoplasma sp. 21DD0573]MEA4276253.1 variable surface lipoprotein [Mycoplasma sp. 21DD0573]
MKKINKRILFGSFSLVSMSLPIVALSCNNTNNPQPNPGNNKTNPNPEITFEQSKAIAISQVESSYSNLTEEQRTKIKELIQASENQEQLKNIQTNANYLNELVSSLKEAVADYSDVKASYKYANDEQQARKDAFDTAYNNVNNVVNYLDFSNNGTALNFDVEALKAAYNDAKNALAGQEVQKDPKPAMYTDAATRFGKWFTLPESQEVSYTIVDTAKQFEENTYEVHTLGPLVDGKRTYPIKNYKADAPELPNNIEFSVSDFQTYQKMIKLRQKVLDTFFRLIVKSDGKKVYEFFNHDAAYAPTRYSISKLMLIIDKLIITGNIYEEYLIELEGTKEDSKVKLFQDPAHKYSYYAILPKAEQMKNAV